MLRAIWEWLWPPACAHEWVEKHSVEAWGVDMFGHQSKNPVQYFYLYTCSKCGQMKKVTIP